MDTQVIWDAIAFIMTLYWIRYRSQRCGCLVTWFCYQLIPKPSNKTAVPSWPYSYFFLCTKSNKCYSTCYLSNVPIILFTIPIINDRPNSVEPNPSVFILEIRVLLYICCIISMAYCILLQWYDTVLIILPITAELSSKSQLLYYKRIVGELTLFSNTVHGF